MIRALIEQTFDSTKKYLVLFGLSTDSKPVSGLITGSEFHEVNTGVKYEFDEVNSQWHEVGITEQEIKDEIDAWLDDHPEATTTVQDGSISYAKLDASLKAKVDTVDELDTEMDNKANIDGSYSSLTAGNAEQLVSTVGVEDKTPYLFRTTGGSADVGDRVKLSEITGGTVAWNQMVIDGDFTDTSHNWDGEQFDSVTINNGVATVVCTSPSVYNPALSFSKQTTKPFAKAILGHVYYANIVAKYPVSSRIYFGSSTSWYTEYLTANEWHDAKFMIKPRNASQLSSTGYLWAYLGVEDTSGLQAGDTIQFKRVAIYDLTQMFGSTIADYIYGLEQNTAGAGVAWFRKLFPKDYYAYDAGTLLSVKTSAHKEYGFNAYDNTTGKAKVVGGQVYQITGTYTALSLDGTSITPDASGYFTPSASGEITVTGGNATDTCIHLKWDGERDGEYEPYEANTYQLDDVELRGIPKLDANNNLYYDGDSYAPDGTVTRKYGIVDLGTMNWALSVPGQFYCEDASFDGANDPNGVSIICSSVLRGGDAYGTGVDNVICVRIGTYKRLWARCSTYSTAAAFKTAMSGVYLVYELVTPTTESADPYQETQVCNDFGTEEFVDSRTVPMPVGYDALYQANLRAKLEMAPASPSGNGDYIVRQTDGLNEYVLLEKELPTAPAEDGTYSLKCTVASGTATLSWVADA